MELLVGKINKGKQLMKKQRGMTAFYSVIKKRSESSDEEGGRHSGV